jgi:hypothetical protein
METLGVIEPLLLTSFGCADGKPTHLQVLLLQDRNNRALVCLTDRVLGSNSYSMLGQHR